MKHCIRAISILLALTMQANYAFISKSPKLQTLEQKIERLIKTESPQPISLSEFDNFMNNLDAAPIVKKLFSNLSFQVDKSLEITQGPTGLGDNFALTGHLIFPGSNTLVDGKVTVSLHDNKRNFTFDIMVPDTFKFSTLEPKFSIIDEISFIEHKYDKRFLPPHIIITTQGYHSKALGVEVIEGTNFISGVGLGGALSVKPMNVNNMLTQLKKHGNKFGSAFSFEPLEFRFVANISPEILNSSFTITLPLNIDINLEKKFKKPFIDAIKISDLSIAVYPLPTLSIEASAGAQLVLPTQKDPLIFDATFIFGLDDVGIRLTMDGDYEPAFGLKNLGFKDFGFEVGIDFADLTETAALGIPITDLELRGDLLVGPSKKETQFDFAGKFEFEPDKDEVDVSLIAKIENFSIKELIEFLGDLAGKSLGISAIPNLALRELDVYFVPLPTQIAGKIYEAGIGANMDAFLWGTKFNLYFSVDPKELAISGKATFDDLNIKVGSIDFFDLKDISSDLYISALEPEKSYFKGKGDFSLPFLKISDSFDFDINNDGFYIEDTAKIGDLFEAKLGVNIAFSNFKKSDITFYLQNDFEEYLRKELPAQLKKFREQADEQIDSVGPKIEQAEKILEAEKHGFNDKIIKQIQDTNNTIHRIKERIAAAKKECPHWTPFKSACYDYTAQNVALGYQEKFVKGFLLKFGEQVVDFAYNFAGSLEDLGKQVVTWKALESAEKSTVQAITTIAKVGVKILTDFQLRKAVGSFTGKDLETLSSPQIDILEVQIGDHLITIKDIQFDFEKLEDALEDIAKKLIDEIKKVL